MDNFLNEIWGIDRLFIKSDEILQANAEHCAILLSANRRNFDRFFSLASFKEILNFLNLPLNLFGIQKGQIEAISAIKALKISRMEVVQNLLLLRDEKIIENSDFEAICAFINGLELIENEVKSPKEMEFGFYKSIANLNEIADELVLFEPKIAEIKRTANENKFTLAVTGVINAGKSSMLNALLGSQILGTSNIPETANLTLIEFQENPSAEVIFYDEAECEILGIERSFENREIPLEKLRDYTSAKFEISKYVKMIKLGLNESFLADNIDIVDTPGLDDSVILRENLTKYFMNKSDAVIHLMNAAQSATNKDMSFIVTTLKTSKNGTLIVVLTHADLLSQNELIDALNYTKKAIRDDLESYGFEANLVENVKFFCIDSVSKMGIAELKSFIYDEFFGPNSKKANLILENYKKDLLLNCENLELSMKNLLSNLSLESSEALAAAEALNAQISALDSEIKATENEVSEALAKFDYSNENFSLKREFLGIKERVISDIKYAKNKKQKVDFARLSVILTSGVNDAIIDIFRSFSQRISKDIDNVSNLLGAKFGAQNEFKFDTKRYFDEHFETPNFDEICAALPALVKENDDLIALSGKLEERLDQFGEKLNLKKSLNSIAETCTREFKASTQRIFESKKSALLNEREKMAEILANSGENGEISKEKILNLKSDLEKLESLKQRILQ